MLITIKVLFQFGFSQCVSLKVQIRCSSIHFFFSKVSTKASVLSFLLITLEIDVAVDEIGFSRVIDSLAGLVIDLTELS